MPGQFLQSTSKNFLGLRYGLDKTVTKVQDSYQDLIKDKRENLCKRNNNDLERRIRNLINLLNTLTRVIRSILTVLQKLLKFVSFIKKLLIGLTVLTKVLKFFPLPARWAIVGMIVKMGDLLAKITFKLKAGLLIITGVDLIVNYMTKSLSNLILVIEELIRNLKVIVSQLLDCSKSLQSEANNTTPPLSDSLANSATLRKNLSDDLNGSLDDLTKSLNDLKNQFGTLASSSTSYKGFTFLILEEEVVETSVVAKRRYAVALNANGILTLQGDLSYATDTQVLIDELKLRIDNEGLTGYPGVKNTESNKPFKVDESGNIIINPDGSIDSVTSGDLESEIDIQDLEDEAIRELGFNSIEEIEKDAKNSVQSINDLLSQDSAEKTLKDQYEARQQRFIRFLSQKSNEGNNIASDILTRINSGELSISEAKSEWLERSKNTDLP